MTDPRPLLIPEERERHPRPVGPSAYWADEGAESERDDKVRLAFFTPSAKGDTSPSYIGPPSRRTKWQLWRAWLTAQLGS